MASDPQRVRAVFLKAVESPPTERPALLERECAGDPELRRRVETLLLAHDRSGSFLDRPVDPAFTDSPTRPGGPPPPRPVGPVGTQLGPYTLLEPLGEGGMGAVWVAEQERPVQRRVAVKLIKPGMDSEQVVRRFEAERQALALMDHPNIAKILDAGSAPDGRPYFVMELVRGVPITAYCEEQRLTVRQRLDLFIPVCRAIQHAHQKGIIHRDVKPSNVLVTLQDGRPVPRVIDFGIAKATGRRLTDVTEFTAVGQVVGTLDYMAPEQADPGAMDVDTRADVYALGAMLYELLTGTTPLDSRGLKGVSLLEVLRKVREEEPPRPSARLTEANAPRAREVRGDLDWIVMKALEKDRTRRYETATDLARDVERHLADEPVEACPPSRSYRVRKFLRKHRASVTTAAALVTLLVAGVTVSTWQAVRATAAENEAVAEGKEKDKARERAAAETVRANAAASRSRTVTAFVQNDVLLQADSVYQSAHGFLANPNLTARALLDRAAARIGDRFKDQPLDEAAIRHTLGVAYEGVGEFDKAAAQLEKALAIRAAGLPEDDPDRLSSLSRLGRAHRASGRPEQALPLLEQARARLARTLGPDHRDSLGSTLDLAAALHDAGRFGEALELMGQAADRLGKSLGPDDPDTLTTQLNLARLHRTVGRLDLALPLAEAAVARMKATLPPDYPHTFLGMVELAGAYLDAGRLDEAVPLLEHAVEKLRAKLSPDHPYTLVAVNSLAGAYRVAGDSARALPLFKEVLAKQRVRLGPDHPHTLQSMNNLASAYMSLGETGRAIRLFQETITLQTAKRGPHHPDTLRTLANLGTTYRQAGMPSEALGPLREAFRHRARHPSLARTGTELMLTYNAIGKVEEATALVPEVLADARRAYPTGGIQLARVLHVVGATLLLARAEAEAETLLRECARIRTKERPDDWTTFNTLTLLGGALLGQRRYAEAELPLLRGYNGTHRRAGQIPERDRKSHLGDAEERLVRLYLEWGQWGEAARWLNELAARRRGRG